MGLGNYREPFSRPDTWHRSSATTADLHGRRPSAARWRSGLLIARGAEQAGSAAWGSPAPPSSPRSCSPASASGWSGCSSSTRLAGVLAWPAARASAPRARSGSTTRLLSLVMVIIVFVWKNLGYAAVIYLAGLQSINKDMLEAAPDRRRRARGGPSSPSCLPLLSPTTFFAAGHQRAELAAGLRHPADHEPAGPGDHDADLRGLPAGLRRLQPGRLLRDGLHGAVRHAGRRSPSPAGRLERRVHYR